MTGPASVTGATKGGIRAYTAPYNAICSACCRVWTKSALWDRCGTRAAQHTRGPPTQCPARLSAPRSSWRSRSSATLLFRRGPASPFCRTGTATGWTCWTFSRRDARPFWAQSTSTSTSPRPRTRPQAVCAAAAAPDGLSPRMAPRPRAPHDRRRLRPPARPRAGSWRPATRWQSTAPTPGMGGTGRCGQGPLCGRTAAVVGARPPHRPLLDPATPRGETQQPHRRLAPRRHPRALGAAPVRVNPPQPLPRVARWESIRPRHLPQGWAPQRSFPLPQLVMRCEPMRRAWAARGKEALPPPRGACLGPATLPLTRLARRSGREPRAWCLGRRGWRQRSRGEGRGRRSGRRRSSSLGLARWGGERGGRQRGG